MKLPGQLAARYLPEHGSAHVIIVLTVDKKHRNCGIRLTELRVSETQVEFKRVTFAEFIRTDNAWCSFK